MNKEKTVKILIGITENNLIVYSELNLRTGYFSVTHNTLRELITEEEGEERARESLEDGELWRQAVEAEHTTQSLNDWVDDVLNIDGWETTLDANYFGEYEGESYYSTWDSCGASIDDFKVDYFYKVIPQFELDLIIESDKLHIKNFKEYTKEDKLLLKKVEDLMSKYDNIKDDETKIIEKWLENN